MLKGSMSNNFYKRGLVGTCPRCSGGQLLRSYPDNCEAQCLQCGYIQYGDVSESICRPDGYDALAMTKTGNAYRRILR